MKKHCVLFVTGRENAPFSLPEVMSSKSQWWAPQTTSIVQLLFTASSFCRFWEDEGEACQKFTWGVTPWKALSPFHHFFNGHVGKEELPCSQKGRQDIIRKERLAQQCGHRGCCAAGPGCTSTAHNSSVSFGTATSLSFKWTTVHSCGYISLIPFSPECVSTEAIGGPHYISAATKARQNLQKWISILTPADMLWLLCPLNENIIWGPAGVSQHRSNEPKETVPIYLSEDLAQGIHNGWSCLVKKRLEQLEMTAFLLHFHSSDSFCQMLWAAGHLFQIHI